MADKVVSWEEFEKHIFFYDCWVMVEEKVYNVTDFLVEHPGGDAILIKYLDYHVEIVAKMRLAGLMDFLILSMLSVSGMQGLSARLSLLSLLRDI